MTANTTGEATPQREAEEAVAKEIETEILKEAGGDPEIAALRDQVFASKGK